MSCTTGPGPQNGLPMPIGGGPGGMPTMPGCEDGGASLKAQKTKAEQAVKVAGCDSLILVRRPTFVMLPLGSLIRINAGVVDTAGRFGTVAVWS